MSPAGRLSDPRQIVARAMYRMPQRAPQVPSGTFWPLSSSLPTRVDGDKSRAGRLDSFRAAQPPRYRRLATEPVGPRRCAKVIVGHDNKAIHERIDFKWDRKRSGIRCYGDDSSESP